MVAVGHTLFQRRPWYWAPHLWPWYKALHLSTWYRAPQKPGPKEDMLNNSIYIKLQKQTKLIYGVINLNMWLHFEVVIRKGHQDFWDVSSDFVWVPLAL